MAIEFLAKDSLYEKVLTNRDFLANYVNNSGIKLTGEQLLIFAANEVFCHEIAEALLAKNEERAKFLSDAVKVFHKKTPLDSAINVMLEYTKKANE